MLMKCYSVSGSGKEFDQGTWEVKIPQKNRIVHLRNRSCRIRRLPNRRND